MKLVNMWNLKFHAKWLVGSNPIGTTSKDIIKVEKNNYEIFVW